ncbi:MAG TPA: ABC transporter ATP-binding protein [Burkholderiales bacterium]|nr:ABC transporter ATP-binding protein [Burkholderiales bacterium]
MNEPLLQLSGLVKRFGGLAATDGVDLDVRAGEIHALIGPNGAGKTTLVQLVCGGVRSDQGRVIFDGADITGLSMHERVRRGLARSYQVTSIFARLCVLENVVLAVQARHGSSFRFWSAAAREFALAEEAMGILVRIGLKDRARVAAGSLAHGEQRQLEVALALATRPHLLLLDEPMAGMGPEESARMVELIAQLNRELTVLLIEHDMDAVFKLATRISVLVSGRIIASGAPEAIRRNEEVRRAYLGDEVGALS